MYPIECLGEFRMPWIRIFGWIEFAAAFLLIVGFIITSLCERKWRAAELSMVAVIVFVDYWSYVCYAILSIVGECFSYSFYRA